MGFNNNNNNFGKLFISPSKLLKNMGQLIQSQNSQDQKCFFASTAKIKDLVELIINMDEVLSK